MKNRKFKGQVFLTYVIGYGLGRFIIEGLRTDALFIGNTGIRVSQLLGFLLFCVATGLIVYGLKMAKKNPAVEVDAE